MKTKEEVEKRLKKLRVRYAKKYVDASQQRVHMNCLFNREHVPTSVRRAPAQGEELPMVPRRQVTLVVLKDDAAVRLCMYGADDPARWSGDVCDDDATARSCKMFKPSVDMDQAKAEFLDLMADDEYVFDNYRDVATLQWVLGERVHGMPLSWIERLGFWLQSKLSKPSKQTPLLPQGDLPGDLWESPVCPPAHVSPPKSSGKDDEL